MMERIKAARASAGESGDREANGSFGLGEKLRSVRGPRHRRWHHCVVVAGHSSQLASCERTARRRVGLIAARAVVALLAVGAAIGALAIAEGPGRSTTYAGSSPLGVPLTLCVGLGLVAGAGELARSTPRPDR